MPGRASTVRWCGPASEAGRCNDSEPAYERLSRADHQLEPDGFGLGSGAHLHRVGGGNFGIG